MEIQGYGPSSITCQDITSASVRIFATNRGGGWKWSSPLHSNSSRTSINLEDAMNASRLAIDPLWQCLCPSWASTLQPGFARSALRTRRPIAPCLNAPRQRRFKTDEEIRRYKHHGRHKEDRGQYVLSPIAGSMPAPVPEEKGLKLKPPPVDETVDYAEESTPQLYTHMRGAAIKGEQKLCQYLANMLVKERRERPSVQLYNILILSNVGHVEGAAWRVADLIEEMEKEGLAPDAGTCHAALKVLAVHVDHLLRSDILNYMTQRWIQLSEDGFHDVVAGLLREGLFEQAITRLDMMRNEGMHINGWLLDMAIYTLCEASEIGEAYRIMRHRVDAGDLNISRSLWWFFLDKASDARHHAATALAWSTQVEQKYINPSSGICLNVLVTAAKVADAPLATSVFTHLSKRGAAFQPIHYELLINTYLATDPPDFERALSILTIMALEKVEPSITETRPLYLYMHDKPHLLPRAIEILRNLHSQGRKIPIAALNLIIECYVENENLADAMKLYKQIHTFAPMSEGAQRSFANIETFNLLLKGCRTPPNAAQGSFLVSELLALRIAPTALTYDRLILLFTSAATDLLTRAHEVEEADRAAQLRRRGLELLDWAYRHFTEMQPLRWLPRFGTLEQLCLDLAKAGDERCWDVLQIAEDEKKSIEGWEMKSRHVRRNIMEAWEAHARGGQMADEMDGVAVGAGGS